MLKAVKAFITKQKKMLCLTKNIYIYVDRNIFIYFIINPKVSIYISSSFIKFNLLGITYKFWTIFLLLSNIQFLEIFFSHTSLSQLKRTFETKHSTRVQVNSQATVLPTLFQPPSIKSKYHTAANATTPRSLIFLIVHVVCTVVVVVVGGVHILLNLRQRNRSDLKPC